MKRCFPLGYSNHTKIIKYSRRGVLWYLLIVIIHKGLPNIPISWGAEELEGEGYVANAVFLPAAKPPSHSVLSNLFFFFFFWYFGPCSLLQLFRVVLIFTVACASTPLIFLPIVYRTDWLQQLLRVVYKHLLSSFKHFFWSLIPARKSLMWIAEDPRVCGFAVFLETRTDGRQNYCLSEPNF